jgi:membrane associated rhomboid family serine protease
MLALTMAAIWGVSLYGLANHDLIYTLALVPRDANGALGILTMPLVHGSMTHLTINSSLLVVMAVLVLLRGPAYYLSATLIILIAGGCLLWLIGRDGAHIGASALIFGYFGLLATRGFFERQFWSLLGSILIGFVYAGLLWGIVPGDEGVSWEGHLTGLVAGIAAASILSARRVGVRSRQSTRK